MCSPSTRSRPPSSAPARSASTPRPRGWRPIPAPIPRPVPRPRPETSPSRKRPRRASDMSKVNRVSQLLAASSLIGLASLAGGCSSLDRIKNIGEQPALAAIENPTTKPGYQPVHMPMPEPTPAVYNENSLWRSGSREFFKDQRAHQVGDILTVTVNITDNAKTANETQRSRSNSEDSGVTDFLGSKTLKNPATALLPGKILTADSTASSDGNGSITRQEAVQTNVAAVVTQVL